MLTPSSLGFAFGVRERSLAAATVDRGPPLERDRLAELAVGAYSDCRSRRGWAADDEVEVSASAATVEGRAAEDGARAVRAGVCSDDDDPPPPMEGLRRAEVERAERSDEEAPATFVNLSIEPKHFSALLNGTHVRGCADGRCRHTANPAKKASKWASTSS